MLSERVKTYLPIIKAYLANQPIDRAWLFGCLLPFALPSADRDKILIYERES
ncbi:MAG: hypothetical protein LUD17_03470 [Bacteroidales bacterium]|nr:hypothetical protein [Bacteroidales bacterium]